MLTKFPKFLCSLSCIANPSLINYMLVCLACVRGWHSLFPPPYTRRLSQAIDNSISWVNKQSSNTGEFYFQ